MDVALARQAAALAALLVFLARGGAPTPGVLAVAGVAGLAVFAALGVGGAALRRLLAAPPPAAAPPAPDDE